MYKACFSPELSTDCKALHESSLNFSRGFSLSWNRTE